MLSAHKQVLALALAAGCSCDITFHQERRKAADDWLQHELSSTK